MTDLNYAGSGRPPAKAAFSLPSVLAAICAIACFFVGPGLQLVLAIAAGVLGLIGFLLALLPGVRGGIVSILSILLSLVALGVFLLRVVFRVLT